MNDYPERLWTLHSKNIRLVCSGPIPRAGDFLIIQGKEVFRVTRVERNLDPKQWATGPDTLYTRHVNVIAVPQDLNKLRAERKP